MISVTRLSEFRNFKTTNSLTKVAQIFAYFCSIFKNITFWVISAMATFVKKLGYFIFQLWSHCFCDRKKGWSNKVLNSSWAVTQSGKRRRRIEGSDLKPILYLQTVSRENFTFQVCLASIDRPSSQFFCINSNKTNTFIWHKGHPIRMRSFAMSTILQKVE